MPTGNVTAGPKARLAAVILVLVVAALALYAYLQHSGGYDVNVAAQSRLDYMRDPLLEFARRHGALPSESEGLNALVKEGLLKDSSLVDPAGRPYVYKCGVPDCSIATVSSVSGPAGRVVVQTTVRVGDARQR